jgi:hypothetical protein
VAGIEAKLRGGQNESFFLLIVATAKSTVWLFFIYQILFFKPAIPSLIFAKHFWI